MNTSLDREHDLAYVAGLAAGTAKLGADIGLPYLAAAADIASAEPMIGPDGRPLAETVFRWIDPSLKYWTERSFALRSQFIYAMRCCAEPFWYSAGRYGTWRHAAALEALDASSISQDFGVGGAIIAPAYMPGGVIGGVVWATPDPGVDVTAIFDAHAATMHADAMRLVGAYGDAMAGSTPPARLTRREIQCLKWAAAGKTDSEVAQIMDISLPTVRFHIRNAAAKLQVAGRAQATHRAAVLGYVSGAASGGRLP